MKKNGKIVFPFTMDLTDEKGNTWATISVVPSKNSFKRDILFMDPNNGNFSVRSITELLNMLEKYHISLEDKKKVVEFLAERLIYLEKIKV